MGSSGGRVWPWAGQGRPRFGIQATKPRYCVAPRFGFSGNSRAAGDVLARLRALAAVPGPMARSKARPRDCRAGRAERRRADRDPARAARAVRPAPAGPRSGAALRSSTWRASCCAVTASCSGACSSARPTSCRRGGICCVFIAGSRRAGTSAAAASSPASPANSSPRPKRSACRARGAHASFGCLDLAFGSRPAQPCRYPDAWAKARGADRNTGRVISRRRRRFSRNAGRDTSWQARKALLRGPSVFFNANLRRGSNTAVDAARIDDKRLARG
jgi:hypothetical protein